MEKDSVVELDAALKRQVAEGGLENSVRPFVERFDEELTNVIHYLERASFISES